MEKYKGEISFLGINLSKKSEETLHFTVLRSNDGY